MKPSSIGCALFSGGIAALIGNVTSFNAEGVLLWILIVVGLILYVEGKARVQ